MWYFVFSVSKAADRTIFRVLHSILFHLSSLRFHCSGGARIVCPKKSILSLLLIFYVACVIFSLILESYCRGRYRDECIYTIQEVAKTIRMVH
jgi:hypothetical protein